MGTQQAVDKDEQWVGVTEETAKRFVDKSLSRSMFVRFLRDKMEEVGALRSAGVAGRPLPAGRPSRSGKPDRKQLHAPHLHGPTVQAGCTVGKDFIRIEHCQADVGGGFRPPDGVVICHNHLATQEEIEHAITHELIHAYDHCRAKNMDWTNCEHHACSEIRAASLSGERSGLRPAVGGRTCCYSAIKLSCRPVETAVCCLHCSRGLQFQDGAAAWQPGPAAAAPEVRAAACRAERAHEPLLLRQTGSRGSGQDV